MEDQEVLILDEPFNGLDRQGTEDIRNLLLKLVENGKILVMTSHNQEDIDVICSRVYLLDALRVEQIR